MVRWAGRDAVDICCLVVWFGVFSFFGWLAECLFCSVRDKAWDNRGFLFGPVCPIYGAGGTAAIVVFSTAEASAGGRLEPWLVFVASALGASAIEYVTSWYLEKRFHARWWDYSHVPLNIKGRVCLPFALAFGAGGLAIYELLLATVTSSYAAVPAVAWEVAALAIVGLFGADLALTEAALNDLVRRMEQMQGQFDAVMETAVDDAVSGRVPLSEDAQAAAQLAAEKLAASLGGLQRRALDHITTFPRPSTSKAAAAVKGALKRIRE